MSIKCKAKKQGDSLMIAIPAVFEVNEGQEFIMMKKDSGQIVMIPKVANYYKSASVGEFHEALDWRD